MKQFNAANKITFRKRQCVLNANFIAISRFFI